MAKEIVFPQDSPQKQLCRDFCSESGLSAIRKASGLKEKLLKNEEVFPVDIIRGNNPIEIRLDVSGRQELGLVNTLSLDENSTSSTAVHGDLNGRSNTSRR